jgi:glycerol-3-phosphate acyltransferase PlsX
MKRPANQPGVSVSEGVATSMRVAVDAMGGDFGPAVIVPSSLIALADPEYPDLSIVFVGQHDKIEPLLSRMAEDQRRRVHVVDAPDEVAMSDAAARAVRSKPKSSMAVGLQLLKTGEADAFMSAGHSGAVMAGALGIIGRVPGVARPALVTVLPTLKGRSMLLDLGAVTDPKPRFLVQYAIMATTYATHVLGLPNPKVALLSNGEEPSKGNLLVQEVFPLLAATPGINFVGNTEGKELLRGDIEIFVTDGFTGNVALKSMEGAVSALTQVLREEVTKGIVRKALALMLRPALREVRLRLDYEEIGGAPLLGVNGAVIVGHGRSRERAIANAVRVASRTASQNIPAEIARSIQASGAIADVTV